MRPLGFWCEVDAGMAKRQKRHHQRLSEREREREGESESDEAVLAEMLAYANTLADHIDVEYESDLSSFRDIYKFRFNLFPHSLSLSLSLPTL